MKKRYWIIASVILVLVMLGVWAVPVFADDAAGSTPPTPTTQPGNRVRILVRLLLVQDEARVDTFIAKAKAAGKLNDDQATKLKTFWTNHHAQFAKRVVLARLLSARDESKVKAFLDKAVGAGKIKQEQADKVIAAWEALHK